MLVPYSGKEHSPYPCFMKTLICKEPKIWALILQLFRGDLSILPDMKAYVGEDHKIKKVRASLGRGKKIPDTKASNRPGLIVQQRF